MTPTHFWSRWFGAVRFPAPEWMRFSLIALPMVMAGSCSTASAQKMFPEPSALPPQPALPDPLTFLDGRKVTSKSQWDSERRPELKALFEHYMYGAMPPAPAAATSKTHVLGEYHDFLEGKATLKLVRIETGPGPAPQIDLMLVLPNQRRGPVPVFLAINFCGNQDLTSDPRVPLTRTWMPDSCPGCVNHAATDAARGSQATNWPLAEIVARGCALAAFYHGDVDSDRADASNGVYAWLANGDQAKNKPADRGTIAAWAWGFHRCVDYLMTDSSVDHKRIAAVGHSRNGKAALLAAAFDDRIAIAFPHQAGCGGTAPSRGKSGESVKAINDRFPHWFNSQFKQFNEQPERLPMDQNCLVALCAPRPVLFSCAEGDQWSNPAGQFDVLKAADPAYRLLGVKGISETHMPPLNQRVGDRLGYFIRPGKHSMTAEDWNIFLQFAEDQWGKP
jgi:hypothetical protein